MNSIEKEMLEIICNLRDNYNMVAVKAEFEDEGSHLYDIIRLSEIVFRANVKLYIKIGGCGSVNDLYACRLLGASGIIAPMIESSFAMQKYIESINKVFSKEEQDEIIFICNIETVTCCKNIDEILSINNKNRTINHFTIGRTDLSSSMNLSKKDINNEKLFQNCNQVISRAKQMGYTIGLGGGMTSPSIETVEFILNLKDIDQFESRKMVFMLSERKEKSIKMSLDMATIFEMLYIKNKEEFYQKLAFQDNNRSVMLMEHLRKM